MRSSKIKVTISGSRTSDHDTADEQTTGCDSDEGGQWRRKWVVVAGTPVEPGHRGHDHELKPAVQARIIVPGIPPAAVHRRRQITLRSVVCWFARSAEL